MAHIASIDITHHLDHLTPELRSLLIQDVQALTSARVFYFIWEHGTGEATLTPMKCSITAMPLRMHGRIADCLRGTHCTHTIT